MRIAVIGPTASGKSDFALKVGDALGGPEAVEIVGADAMQFYRGMNVGTAKVTGAEQRGYMHHQIDVLDITEDAAVAEYQSSARDDVADILRRGKVPIIVGGSGLYLRALLDRIDFPGTDPAVRERLETELRQRGPAELHRRLEQLDPEAASRIDPRNGRRTVRALEVIEITGRPYSATLPAYSYFKPTVQVGLKVPADVLDERIEERNQKMFDAGLVDEVRELERRGLAGTRTASRATGYSQVLQMLAGEITEEEAKSQIALSTRQLARRQMKWFRRDPRVMWLDPRDDSAIELVLERLADAKNSETLL